MKEIENILNWLNTAGVTYQDSDTQRQLGITILQEEVDELKHGIIKKSKEEILDGLVDTIWMLVNNMVFNNVSMEDFKSYLDKVSESNWSKFCTDEEEAKATVLAYSNGTHPDKLRHIIECTYERVGDSWVVKRMDGKVMKSLNYKPV